MVAMRCFVLPLALGLWSVKQAGGHACEQDGRQKKLIWALIKKSTFSCLQMFSCFNAIIKC